MDLINKSYISREWQQVVTADDYDSPWIKACRLRSNIESFHTMFSSFTGRLKDSKIVEYIEERQGAIEEGLRLKPEKIPNSLISRVKYRGFRLVWALHQEFRIPSLLYQEQLLFL